MFPLTGFPNKEKRRLLYLAGTVPVHYEGDDVLRLLRLTAERCVCVPAG